MKKSLSSCFQCFVAIPCRSIPDFENDCLSALFDDDANKSNYARFW